MESSDDETDTVDWSRSTSITHVEFNPDHIWSKHLDVNLLKPRWDQNLLPANNTLKPKLNNYKNSIYNNYYIASIQNLRLKHKNKINKLLQNISLLENEKKKKICGDGGEGKIRFNQESIMDTEWVEAL